MSKTLGDTVRPASAARSGWASLPSPSPSLPGEVAHAALERRWLSS